MSNLGRDRRKIPPYIAWNSSAIRRIMDIGDKITIWPTAYHALQIYGGPEYGA
jgi:hypothetical protein